MILDEAHERDVYTDFALLVLKRVLQDRASQAKLVLPPGLGASRHPLTPLGGGGLDWKGRGGEVCSNASDARYKFATSYENLR